MRLKTLCFSGHRPKDLFGYDKAAYAPLFSQLVESVGFLYELGYRQFISGGAQGFDQLAFWAVDAAKEKYPDIRNVVYIPFEGQEQKWPEDTAFGRAEYRAMLSAADEVKVVSQENSVAALFARNTAMLQDSDGLLALFEDSSWKTATKGGTAQCIRDAYDHYMMDIWQIVFDKNKPAPYEIKMWQECVFK